MQATPFRRSLFLFALVALAFVGYHVFGYAGHFGYDDMVYAKLASQLTNGTFRFSNEHFGFRWGLLLPLSFCYRLFDVNDDASALPAMAATLITSGLMLYALRERIALQAIGVALFALNPWTIYYSDKIMPDCMVALAVFAAVMCVYRQRFVASHQPVLNAALFAASLAFGMLSKESILITAPLFMLLLVCDWWQRRNMKFWLFACGWCVAAGTLYLVTLDVLTGDILSRWHAIKANAYLNPCSYEVLPISATVKRVGWELAAAFIRGGMAVSLIFSLIGWCGVKPFEFLRMKDPRAFFTLTAATAFLCANFMTTSLSAYVPLCPDVRHYLFVIPIAAVAGAFVIVDFVETKRFAWVIALVLLGVTVASYVNGYEYTWLLYAPLLLLACLRIVVRSDDVKLVNVFAVLTCVTLIAAPLRDAWVNRNNGYVCQRDFIRQHVLSLRAPSVVITDVVQRNFGNYYIGFNTRSNIRFVSFQEFKQNALVDSTNGYLLNCGYTRWLSGTNWETLPALMKNENELEQLTESDCVKMFRLKPTASP